VNADNGSEQRAPATTDASPPPRGGPEERSGSPRGGGGGGGFRRGGRGGFSRRKVCAFCVDKIEVIDYKDPGKLRRYVTERGKIEPRRKTGTCARHQRRLTVAIKRARQIALLPFTAGHARFTSPPAGGYRREAARTEAPAPPDAAASGEPAEAVSPPPGEEAATAPAETPAAEAAEPAAAPEGEAVEA
jgi:small subunit ribosomal protein S18